MENRFLRLNFIYKFVTVIIFILISTLLANAETIILNSSDKQHLYINIEKYNLNNLFGKNTLNINLCEGNVKNYCRIPQRNLQVNGLKITKGITIKPEIEGEWRFADYNGEITFTPKVYWRADQSYTVTIDQTIFPHFVVLDQESITFKTKPLLPKVERMSYFQDVNDPSKKLVQAELKFNYPVEQKSLEEKLIWATSSAIENFNLPGVVTYNNNKDEVNIVVHIKDLGQTENVLSLSIAEGVRPLYGGASLSHQVIAKEDKLRQDSLSSKQTFYKYKEQVLIPSIYSYFKVQDVSVQVVKNNKFVPEQVLIIQTNAPITPQELKNSLELFLLPKDKPTSFIGGFAKKNYEWQSFAEVTDNVIKQSEKVNFESIPIIGEHSATNSFKIDTIPGRYLLLRLKQGVKSYGNFTLDKDYSKVIATPIYPKEISIMSEGSILPLSGEKKLSIYSLGVDRIKVEIDKINCNDINHLISQSYKYGKFQNLNFVDQFNEYNIAQVFEEEIILNNQDIRIPQYSTFDFSKYMKKKLLSNDNSKGLFFIKVFNKDKEKNKIIEDKRLILITDLGFLVKNNQDGSEDIFVASIVSGKPIRGAKVEVIGLNGQAIANTETNIEGHATLPNVKNLTREKSPTAYIVRYGQDLSFMPYGRVDRQVNYSKFNVDGVVTSASKLKAYLFSDRGVYKPGEKVNIGMIVKQANWQNGFAGLPLELEVVNPRSQVVSSRKVILNKEGFIEYLFQTNETSPTGVYNIILYITKDGRRDSQLGSTTIRVEDFLPDRMKIKSNFIVSSKKLWVKPESLKSSVDLVNLYGTPAINKKIAANIILTPAEFVIPEFQDYTFYSGSQKNNKSFTEQLNDAVTNENGKAEFDLNLQKYSDATYRLNFFAEGFESDSGRSVQITKSILVSPYDYVVGFKTNGNLEYINQKDECKLKFIAVNSNGSKIDAPNLELELKKINYVNSLTVQQNGTYAYQSVPIEVPFYKTAVDITYEGYDYTLPTTEVGEYVLYVVDKNGIIFAQSKFTVVGEGNVSASLTKDVALKIKTDKANYKSGEEIAVNITSPYTGYGLITIETDKVHSFKWFQTNNTNTVQKIKIPDYFEGKGFLSVQFIRSFNSKEIFINPFSYATIPFSADIDKRDQKVVLKVLEKAKAGKELIITYSTKKPGKIVVFGVDEGILLFGKYKVPDPIAYFIKDQALEVSTSHILDLILPKYSMLKMLSSAAGDDFINDGKNLNPFKRKDQPPVVFWSGIIDADKTERNVNFAIPDYFNGTLRIMAVSVAEDAVGASQATSTVRGSFVISPNIPLFVTPQDEFIVPITIANNVVGSGKNAKVKLDVTVSEHLEIIDYPKEILITEEQDSTAKVKVKVKDKLGPASVKVTVSLNDQQASITSTTSVRPPTAIVTTIDTSYHSISKEVEIKIPRNLYEEFSKIEVSASTLPVPIISGLKGYLDSYPYGCTEQLVSKSFPNVLLYDQRDLVSTLEIERKKLDETLNRIFSTIRERQNYEGGFSAWNNFGETDNFTSVYTMHFLTEAASKNLPIPSDSFNAGISYLKNMANRSITSLIEAREKAYAVYILTRNNEVTTSYLANILNYLEVNEKDYWHNDLIAVYIAATYKMLQMIPEANALIDKVIQANAPINPNLQYSFYDNLIKYSQYVYVLSLHFPEKLASMDKTTMGKITSFINEGSYNTIASSYAIMAVLAYANSVGNVENSSFILKAYDQENKELKLDLKGDKIKVAKLDTTVASLKLISSHKDFFYQLLTSGFDKKIDNNIVEKGIELKRQYLDDNGNEVKEVKLGDVINVLLTVRSGSSKILDNIAVVDLLPGGFELQTNYSANKEDKLDLQWNTTYVDRREDRIIMFGSVPNYEVQYKYKIRAVNSGNFTVPAPYAESMYMSDIYYKGKISNMVVK